MEFYQCIKELNPCSGSGAKQRQGHLTISLQCGCSCQDQCLQAQSAGWCRHPQCSLHAVWSMLRHVQWTSEWCECPHRLGGRVSNPFKHHFKTMLRERKFSEKFNTYLKSHISGWFQVKVSESIPAVLTPLKPKFFILCSTTVRAQTAVCLKWSSLNWGWSFVLKSLGSS